MKVTPEFVVSFETEIKGIVEDNWKRVNANLMWDRVMKLRPSATKREILVWLLETARLYPEGNGGNTRFDDMVATTFSYENDNAGSGLKLTRNEIEDNQLKDNPSVGVLDYARKWANDISMAAMYFPQQQLFNLITNGTTNLAYDGVTYFSAAHPVNPNGGGGTYSNIVAAVPINAPAGAATELDAFVVAQRNFAKALAAVRAQKFLNGIPRYLKPTVMIVPTALQYRAQQLTGGDVLGQTSNVFKALNIDVIVDPLLDAEPDVYYLGVADMMSDDIGAFIWSEREPFSLRTYSMFDEAALNRRDEFEWTMKGRNAAIYGHPYLMYRCTPT